MKRDEGPFSDREMQIKMLTPNRIVLPQASPIKMIANTFFKLGFDFNPDNLVITPLIAENPPISFQPGMPAN